MNIQSDFDKWYEDNKENLTILTREGMLRKAFEAGEESSLKEYCAYCAQIGCSC